MNNTTKRFGKRYGISESEIKETTAHARAIGYKDEKPVVVFEGNVVSHGCKDWFDFCSDLRAKNLEFASAT